MLSVGMFWNLWTEFLHRMKWQRENMEAIRKYINSGMGGNLEWMP